MNVRVGRSEGSNRSVNQVANYVVAVGCPGPRLQAAMSHSYEPLCSNIHRVITFSIAPRSALSL
jgi:hypothetical protein